MTDPILILPALAAFGLVLLLVLIKRRKSTVDQPTTTSLNERMFFPVLEKAVGGRFEIVCKVPVSDVLSPQDDLSKRAQKKALASVSGHLFDYAVIHKDDRSIICVVELDDHKFDKKTFKQQDLYLDKLCQSVGLPLLRVPSKRGYDLAEIIERFERTIDATAPSDSKNKHPFIVKKQYTPQSHLSK